MCVLEYDGCVIHILYGKEIGYISGGINLLEFCILQKLNPM